MADEMAWKNLGPNPSRKEILACWNPEDAGFWEKYGKRIATQNLYTSTWALVLSFVAWALWATIAAKLKFIGFNFSDDQIFTLAALPGLVGATGRLFYTYLPGLIGGRNSTFITTALLLLPLFGLGRALQDPTTSYETFVLLVSFIGIAGANFSASMANIGFFFPKANKGFALGVNAGIGNLGVSLIYLTAPILLGWNLSSLFGEGVPGPDGMMYVQNVCYFWTIPTALTLVLVWLFMDNLPLPKQSPKSMMSIFGNKHTWLMCWIYASAPSLASRQRSDCSSQKNFPRCPFLTPLSSALSSARAFVRSAAFWRTRWTAVRASRSSRSSAWRRIASLCSSAHFCCSS